MSKRLFSNEKKKPVICHSIFFLQQTCASKNFTVSENVWVFYNWWVREFKESGTPDFRCYIYYQQLFNSVTFLLDYMSHSRSSHKLTSMINVRKFLTPKFLTKWHMQTVQSQTSSLIRVYTVCHYTKYFKKLMHKKPNFDKKVWNKVFKILGHSVNFNIYMTQQNGFADDVPLKASELAYCQCVWSFMTCVSK